MVEWLVPVSLFWTLTALYLGGFRLDIQDGPGYRNLGGLLLTFVLFLVVWWAVRTGLGAALPLVAAVAVAALVAGLLLPVLTRVGFRVMGLRIRSAA